MTNKVETIILVQAESTARASLMPVFLSWPAADCIADFCLNSSDLNFNRNTAKGQF